MNILSILEKCQGLRRTNIYYRGFHAPFDFQLFLVFRLVTNSMFPGVTRIKSGIPTWHRSKNNCVEQVLTYQT